MNTRKKMWEIIPVGHEWLWSYHVDEVTLDRTRNRAYKQTLNLQEWFNINSKSKLLTTKSRKSESGEISSTPIFSKTLTCVPFHPP